MTFRSIANIALRAFPIIAMAAVGCSSDSGTTGPQTRSGGPGSLFVRDTTIAVGVSPWTMAVADFDTNGAPDVAVANLGSGEISLLYNSPHRRVFRTATPKAPIPKFWLDSTGTSYRPRALAASDVNADGLPDLVATFMDPDTSARQDRLLVLLNEGVDSLGRIEYDVALDTLAGKRIRDLFVGNIDATDDGVEIVAASSQAGEPPLVVLSRPSKAMAVDSSIRFSGSFPSDEEVDVRLDAAIHLLFNDDVAYKDSLKDPSWVTIIGEIEDIGQVDTIRIASVVAKSVTIDGTRYNQHTLVPARMFRPSEVVTVSVRDAIRGTPKKPHNLSNPTALTFACEGLVIRESQPEDGRTNVSADSVIRLTFNWWLDPTTVATAIELRSRGGTIFPINASYDAEAFRVTVVPQTQQRESLIQPYDDLDLMVTGDLLDSLGRRTFAGDTVGFRIEGPRVIATTPANGSTARPETDPITGYSRIWMRFNTEMSLVASAEALQVIGDQSGRHEIEGIRASDSDRREVAAVLSSRLVAGEWVTCIATDALTSTFGTRLSKPHVWRFMVRPRSESALGGRDGNVGSDLIGGAVVGGRFTPAGQSVVLADQKGALALLAQQTDLSWANAGAIDGVPGWQIVRAGDLNSDGLLDLVTARLDSNYCRVLLNTGMVGGKASFADTATYGVGEFPTSIFLADLDGDGTTDIATANVGTNDVSVLLNLGDGTFGPETFYIVGDHPKAVTGADFDGDGDIDLIAANSTSNTVTVLLNLTALRDSPPVAAK